MSGFDWTIHWAPSGDHERSVIRSDVRHSHPHIAIDGHVRSTIAQSQPRSTDVGRRTTCHRGYKVSRRCRKRAKEELGGIKASAGLAKVKLRGRGRVDAAFALALGACNLIRPPKLLAAPA
ncbi:MAG: hypothetical protein K9G48_07285 [Reyranella sp.]|nr:hypothetical protein [Reyranella sp.]